MIITVVKDNNYMDSIFLMKATKEVMKVDGVKDAVVVMGSDMNKTVLADFGGLTDKAKAAGTNDLIISVDAENEECAANAEKAVMALLTKKDSGSNNGGESKEKVYTSLVQAMDGEKESNLVLISLPGEYAGLEARRALLAGKNVFIFSDLPLKDELELKALGAEKGLLVMGPGAGTAIIDGVSIGLMSKVRRGSIGIVAASGSGLQEVAILAHQGGFGISQAIGTGGRDLSKDVGGSMMLRSMKLLEDDPDTEVIVLVSKPPHPDTCRKIYAQVRECAKPVVIFFLGGNAEEIKASGAYAPATLEEAAAMAMKLAAHETPEVCDYIAASKERLAEAAASEKAKLADCQKYLRGLFCGGTHSEEGVLMLQDELNGLYSNIAFGRTKVLENRSKSVGHTLLDMGDEIFTCGRPHPVIDPTILCDRLLQEGTDPETACILFDIILGYGVHEDPVGCIADTIKEIRRANADAGRYVSMVASVCGTDLDPQDLAKQVGMLRDLGVLVVGSNSQAAILAGKIVS